MQFRRIAAVLVLGFAGLPALAEEPRNADPFARFDPQWLLQGVVTERDVSLLFDHLRISLAAAAAGREPPPAPELEQRAAEIGGELRLRGTLFGLVMLNALEARAKEALRGPRQPSPDSQETPRRN